jgi:hypothetical protein
MKQYYIKEIDLNNIHINKIHLPYKKYTQKIILTNYGYFLFKNNNLIKKKIIPNDSYKIDNFINNYTLCYNDIKHQVFKFSDHINNENKMIEKTIYEFKQHETSKTKLIIERINNNINDLYFISSFSTDDLFLKEDIKILVQLLKC